MAPIRQILRKRISENSALPRKDTRAPVSGRGIGMRLSPGAVVAAIAALFGVPFLVQMLLFIVVTCLLFALTRPVAKRYLNNRVQKTNTDALIGQTALVKETINNMESKGYVQLNGQDWTARSAEAGEIIPAGCEVVVKEIQGVKLIVEREV